MDGVDDTTPGQQAPSTASAPAADARDRRRRRGVLFGAAACALGVGLMGGGYALGSGITAAAAIASTDATTTSPYGTLVPGSGSTGTTTLPGWGSGYGSGGSGSGSSGSASGGTSTSSLDVTTATAAQQVGVVTITTDLYYGQGEAAGTGMILTSDGLVLTNNHVVAGSTSIQVTVESTGETYTAEVVGTDATDDIAVLQLVDANGDDVTGLDTVTLDDDSGVTVGDTVASIGNAEGTGTLVVAEGTVTATDQSITVENELTGDPESLSNLIEVDADVVSGDSGGPLVDAEGEVVGVVTAASSGSTDITGYAIPIEDALDIVTRITAGAASDSITIGTPAFLGVTIASGTSSNGVVIGSVIDGLPAAEAGLAAGDVITSVDGTAVTTYDELSALIDSLNPGDTVTIGYTDAAGASASVAVTLVAGPAD